MQNDLEYQYGGQWFDDMGSLVASFPQSPIIGVQIAQSGISRAQANNLALNLGKANITPYDQDSAPPDIGE